MAKKNDKLIFHLCRLSVAQFITNMIGIHIRRRNRITMSTNLKEKKTLHPCTNILKTIYNQSTRSRRSCWNMIIEKAINKSNSRGNASFMWSSGNFRSCLYGDKSRRWKTNKLQNMQLLNMYSIVLCPSGMSLLAFVQLDELTGSYRIFLSLVEAHFFP